MPEDLIGDLFSDPAPEQPEMPQCPFLIPGEWPTHVLSPHRMRFWCQLDEDFRPELLSNLGDFWHAVDYYIRDVGLDDILNCHCWPHDREINWAAELGITYHQPFYVEVMVLFSAGDEPDCDVEFEIIEIKSLPASVALDRYAGWLNRPHCL